nr:MAG TPA: hypothetical protein [Caudoviricetes sp.]
MTLALAQEGMMTLDCPAYHWCVLCLAGGW